MVRGWKRYGRSKVNKDNDVRLYMDQSEGFLATFAKLAGERGQLAGGDTKRARALLPLPWDPKNVRDRKIAGLRAFMVEKFGALPAPYRKPTSGPAGARSGWCGPPSAAPDPFGAL
jgi:hypothetical protein